MNINKTVKAMNMNTIRRLLLAGGVAVLMSAAQSAWAVKSECAKQFQDAQTAQQRLKMCLAHQQRPGYHCENLRQASYAATAAYGRCQEGLSSGDRMHRNVGGVPEGGGHYSR
ncbi:MAG: hypothetical protein P8076_11315 [Gammaproteobacteria bacterium]